MCDTKKLNIMVDNNTDFFAYVDNIAKIKEVNSVVIFSKEDPSAKYTIAIPTYKRIEYLKEAIDSALNQDCTVSYNVIVVDNNPERDDDTEKLMESYKNAKNLSYYKNAKNLGMGGNWNRCLSMPQTEWVVLLHDDDTIEPDFLQKCHTTIVRHDCSVLQTLKYTERDKRPIVAEGKVYQYAKLDLYHSFRIQAPTGIVFKRIDFIKSGGFSPELFPSLDYCYFAKIIESSKILLLKDYLTFYRLEVNASFKKETHLGWITIDHYLVKNMLTRYGFPSWIVGPYCQSKLKFDAEGIKKEYKYDFQIPEKLKAQIKYSKLSEVSALWIVRLFVVLERLKTKFSRCAPLK